MSEESVVGEISPDELPARPFLKVVRGELRYEGPARQVACLHQHGFWVDDQAGQVLCQKCEEPVSLLAFAHVMMAWHDRLLRFEQRARRERVEALREQLAALENRRAVSENDRARIQRARWAGHAIPVKELVALRDEIQEKVRSDRNRKRR